MENFEYHVPFYVVTGGVDQAGHSSDLKGGQVGLFDRATFSVATGSGSGKEFFFAQGSIGGKDWSGFPITQTSHKSPFFYGKDITDIYLSTPKRAINEEWVLGFNGSSTSKGLIYETGKAIRIKFYFHGQPTYRFFGGPKEYTVSYTPPKDCTAPCAEGDCPDPIVDCLVHTQALINEVNNNIELQKFGVKAKLVTTPYVAVTTTNTKYCLTLCDNGDALALSAVQAQAPAGVVVTRTVRTGSSSTYELCQPDASTAPTAYTQTGSVLQAICGACPGGSNLVAAKDVYIVKRAVVQATDLTSDNAREAYADTVATAYTVTDGDELYLGLNNAVASIQIKVAVGTTVAPQGSDVVTFSHTEGAVCVFTNPSPVSWTTCGVGISSTRTLRINAVNRLDCNAGDRLADLTAILSGVQGIKINTLTKVAGVACVDDYTVDQDSVDCLPEDCLTNNVSFTYDTLPSFENKSWDVVPPTVTPNANRKCGIRITLGYTDPQFGDCSWTPEDYYETDPIKMEVSLLIEDGAACDYKTLPSQQQTVQGQISRQSGNWVARELIMKTASYLKHMNQYSLDSREREAFDKNLQGTVDRKAFYNVYYVTFSASYGFSFRKNEQEKFTAVFAFKEGDAAALTFEASVLGVLTAKSGVALHVNN